MSVLTSGDKWPVAQQSGELVNVEIRPGVKQRMYIEPRRFAEEAIARGLLKEQEKPKDKERERGRNKGRVSGKP